MKLRKLRILTFKLRILTLTCLINSFLGFMWFYVISQLNTSQLNILSVACFAQAGCSCLGDVQLLGSPKVISRYQL